jgi:hypothetical protein
MARAESICTTRIRVISTFILYSTLQYLDGFNAKRPAKWSKNRLP